jgi:DOPA 4,5-dioxygenase
MVETARIQGFHAHVYFDAGTAPQARALCESARDRFGAVMGRMHERPVGPHPEWSCQLAFPAETFGDLVPWLMLHRAGLAILVHPNTGDDLADHSSHALWLGRVLALDLSRFEAAGRGQ